MGDAMNDWQGPVASGRATMTRNFAKVAICALLLFKRIGWLECPIETVR
ncbi:hypothetical protein [Salinihabitans flavidus]|nr:hypothetical protein [Salinihabitans flavidus]